MSDDGPIKLDVKGQCCPLPLIHLSKAIEHLNPGDFIQITGDDPIFENTVRDYCKANSLTINEVIKRNGREVSIIISKDLT